MAVFYYILRPKSERRFKRWWGRGRFVVLLALGMGGSSVVSGMDIFGFMVTAQYLDGFSDNLCDMAASSGSTYARWVTFCPRYVGHQRARGCHASAAVIGLCLRKGGRRGGFRLRF